MTPKTITRFWHEVSDESCDLLTAKLEADGWTFHSMTGGAGMGVMLAFQKPAPPPAPAGPCPEYTRDHDGYCAACGSSEANHPRADAPRGYQSERHTKGSGLAGAARVGDDLEPNPKE